MGQITLSILKVKFDMVAEHSTQKSLLKTREEFKPDPEFSCKRINSLRERMFKKKKKKGSKVQKRKRLQWNHPRRQS